MPTVHEIERREAERAAIDAVLGAVRAEAERTYVVGGRTSRREYEEVFRCCIAGDQLREKAYPSLAPRAEPCKLTDGSTWHYEPHVSESDPWAKKDASAMAGRCYDPVLFSGRRAKTAVQMQMTAADYGALAEAMDRYHAREDSP